MAESSQVAVSQNQYTPRLSNELRVEIMRLETKLRSLRRRQELRLEFEQNPTKYVGIRFGVASCIIGVFFVAILGLEWFFLGDNRYSWSVWYKILSLLPFEEPAGPF
jgi:hypothetical protein